MEPENQRVYVYRPTPKRWIAIMIVLSLLVHVSLIGIASIWRRPVRPPVVEEEPAELIAGLRRAGGKRGQHA